MPAEIISPRLILSLPVKLVIISGLIENAQLEPPPKMITGLEPSEFILVTTSSSLFFVISCQKFTSGFPKIIIKPLQKKAVKVVDKVTNR